jgi:hypothetical protein
MTATYWRIGQHIVEHEQRGAARAAYGERLLKQLSRDLAKRFGRGFSERNLEQMRAFTFVGRQRRLRVGDAWYRVDLLFFHWRLRCLVIIDLKLGKFTHADAGQMHLYLNYAREHWTMPDENPPVGLILCSEKNAAVAHYALENLPNKILAAQYRTTLPEGANPSRHTRP